MWFLIGTALLLAGALVLSHFQEARRAEEIEKRLTQAEGVLKVAERDVNKFKDQAERLRAEVYEAKQSIANVARQSSVAIEGLEKDSKTFDLRLTNAEKRSARSERTIKLEFNGKLPVQHSNEPIVKMKRGAGKGALIPGVSRV